MNVYDFDKTVFPGESSSRFFLFCVGKAPRVLKNLPRAAWFALRWALGRCSLRECKEAFHGYLPLLADPEALAEEFWAKQPMPLPRWLPPLLPAGGLVISASPEFLIAPQCRRLGLAWMGTKMDPHTGRILGENCKGAEKPRRFREAYPDAVVDAFYSDSLSDSPMAALAGEAWLVKGDALRPWPESSQRG